MPVFAAEAATLDALWADEYALSLAKRAPSIEKTFGSAIDLFGDGAIRGIETVDTTMRVPGPLLDPGCPLHGMGCPSHCPVLQAYDEAARR